MVKLLIIDGASGTGKTTLRYKLMQSMDYNILTIDRFTPSIWVYDKLRGIDRQDVLDYEEKFDAMNPLVVICTCNPEIARMRSHVDPLRKVEFPFIHQINAFYDYSKVSRYSRLITVYTLQPIELCLNIIRRAL